MNDIVLRNYPCGSSVERMWRGTLNLDRTRRILLRPIWTNFGKMLQISTDVDHVGRCWTILDWLRLNRADVGQTSPCSTRFGPNSTKVGPSSNEIRDQICAELDQIWIGFGQSCPISDRVDHIRAEVCQLRTDFDQTWAGFGQCWPISTWAAFDQFRPNPDRCQTGRGRTWTTFDQCRPTSGRFRPFSSSKPPKVANLVLVRRSSGRGRLGAQENRTGWIWRNPLRESQSWVTDDGQCQSCPCSPDKRGRGAADECHGAVISWVFLGVAPL